jgi:hypothetical protein
MSLSELQRRNFRGPKIQVHHNTVKKYLTKIEVHQKAKNSAPKTTARQQSIIKARLKLLTRNPILLKINYMSGYNQVQLLQFLIFHFPCYKTYTIKAKRISKQIDNREDETENTKIISYIICNKGRHR